MEKKKSLCAQETTQASDNVYIYNGSAEVVFMTENGTLNNTASLIVPNGTSFSVLSNETNWEEVNITSLENDYIFSNETNTDFIANVTEATFLMDNCSVCCFTDELEYNSTEVRT
uniref:Uncharacterized protein n=1 Tax=Clastoptera arizonana TaxID=38151 RepID=A0A1B6BZI1_9HEMI